MKKDSSTKKNQLWESLSYIKLVSVLLYFRLSTIVYSDNSIILRFHSYESIVFPNAPASGSKNHLKSTAIVLVYSNDHNGLWSWVSSSS